MHGRMNVKLVFGTDAEKETNPIREQNRQVCIRYGNVLCTSEISYMFRPSFVDFLRVMYEGYDRKTSQSVYKYKILSFKVFDICHEFTHLHLHLMCSHIEASVRGHEI